MGGSNLDKANNSIKTPGQDNEARGGGGDSNIDGHIKKILTRDVEPLWRV